jgi:predicted RNase H-like HicB family nuclease
METTRSKRRLKEIEVMSKEMTKDKAMEIIQVALEGYIETCLENEEEFQQERKDLDDAWEIIKGD